MNLEAMIWPDGVLIAFVALVLQIAASVHVLRTKTEVRSAIAWFAIVWLAPGFGLIAYMLFGISRIRRRAQATRAKRGLAPRTGPVPQDFDASLKSIVEDAPNRWHAHDRLAARVASVPLTSENTIEPLAGGREAYDAMISAIDSAEKTVALTTYIFQADQAGRRFLTALTRAKERGVDVKVLVDAVGNLYGLKPVTNLLRRRNIDVATFNPMRLSWRLAFFNLRTHRKLLIVDNRVGFTGGMNIRKHHLEREDGTLRVQDVHFRLHGPILDQMLDAFEDDWIFSGGKELDRDLWAADETLSVPSLSMPARAIADGPDEPEHKTAMIVESALASARQHVQIITPYFLPEQAQVIALRQAALRGVQVDILIPRKSNLPLFSITAISGTKELLKAGCRVLLSPPPFDHTKLMIVDGVWVLFGSSNWDARSLKLNFEFNIECYNQGFGETMQSWVKDRFEKAEPLTLEQLKNRPIHQRVLGRLMWLISPYL